MENRGLEYALGKGLTQPFANTNSGSRKLMYSIHTEQSLPLLNPEMPIVQTGYENRFGDLSSSLIKADADFLIVAKISKFSNIPNHHFYLITRNIHTGELGVIERKMYNHNHNSETYGYLCNTNILDNLEVGFEVTKDSILRTSMATDKYLNRQDGSNLNISYISSNKNMEDGIILSQSGAYKLASPIIKQVPVIIGDNDILLNLYGKDGNFKSFPDILEDVNNGLLCAIRKEKIEECLYMQSINRLNDILMTDEKITVEGTVLDIDIHCNNPAMLTERHSNIQLEYYYRDHIRCITEIVRTIDSLKNGQGKVKMTYELQKLYYRSKYELDGMLFEKEKKYEGTIIDVYLLEKNIPSVGDKITNRYGCKGVISAIVPDENMPLLDNGERLDAYYTLCTCVNRENEGQLHEMSINFQSSRICEYISNNRVSTSEAIDIICRFISHISKQEADAMYKMLYDKRNTDRDRQYFIDKILEDGFILIACKPISESMSLDKLNDIYKDFPFIKPYRVMSCITDSNGIVRYVPGRRTLIAGKVFMLRLKQYAEDKFSATSLSSTNLTNENAKSKSAKNYRSVLPNTPIRFGEMESEDERHMGAYIVVTNLMIHSTSPQARKLTESFVEDDPYEVNIQLDETCRSRNAEKAKVYLKAMGYVIGFYKKLKIKKRLFMPSNIKTPLPGEEKNRLFIQQHPDEAPGDGEEWFDILEKRRKNNEKDKRLFKKRLFSKV